MGGRTSSEAEPTSSASDALKAEINAIDLYEGTLHIGEAESNWGGLKLSTEHGVSMLSASERDVFLCHVNRDGKCDWKYIDEKHSKYSKYEGILFHHLGGAFFSVQGIHSHAHCQIILMDEILSIRVSYDIICTPSKHGVNSAFLHEDLVNYNIFMGTLYPQYLPKPYIYFHGKQEYNHCALYAVNNALSYYVYNPKTFSVVHLDIMDEVAEGAKWNDLTFAKHTTKSGKLVPEEFFQHAVPAALQKMGVVVYKMGDPIHHFAPTIRKLNENPFIEEAFGYLFLFNGIFVDPRTGETEEAIHWFVFKYIAQGWYGFDANEKKVIGPRKRFTDIITETFEGHNQKFTYDISTGKHPTFQIDIGTVLTGSLKKVKAQKMGGCSWYPLKGRSVAPYEPAYSIFTDNYINHNNHGVMDHYLFGNYVLLLFCVAFIHFGICFIVGLFTGCCLYETKNKKQNRVISIV